MTQSSGDPLWHLMGLLFKAHPWHGVAIGPDAPAIVTAYIEIVSTDTVKFEVDKISGYLKIDRPQQFSNVFPYLYGLIPRTLCAERIGELSASRSGRSSLAGDGDPLDICVLTEKAITHGDILVQAIPIGGLRIIDRDEADDKIIAVLKGDAVFGDLRELNECPTSVLDRLKHYFLTYKLTPDSQERKIELAGVFGREEAYEVIKASRDDYNARFAGIYSLLRQAAKG